ncbi:MULTISPECIES: hypothetical protein [Enterobacteriaceae]|uniref:hypothetical protein n=1 Tax=Enterobacteriaceae TaxID=543 RepID=UPI000B9B2C97|nr:hypothetical protein [Leclercia adecarboxylata]MDV5280135.1 hypothetical protein [Leclercia adecarboxylata]MDV5464041.1 hypothetical protein [Leclercia adecarboxylata]MDV5505873.1 hypothetical protein [Leclercia adecarboxylata]MDV5534841.1 hypothetical protein [Leclercia adecarboxylata]MDV5593517.1 hypothetical protein [Leclercia adecarboxylata]
MARPKGALNKRPGIPKVLLTDAMAKLAVAVGAGEPWAIQAVLDRHMPKLKAVTPEDSLDARVLEARIFELVEMDKRLTALEENNDK